MSKRVPSPPPTGSDEENPAQLVQAVRQALIKSQLVVLELNDRVLQKETDKADAVSLLGQAELVLEQKISHIMELDRVLNLRIQELEAALKQSQGDHQSTTSRHEESRRQTDEVIADLTSRLDQLNQELGRTHEMAGKTAQQLAATEQALAGRQETTRQLQSEVATLRQQLTQSETAKTQAQRTIAELKSSWPLRMTRLFRRPDPKA